MATGKHRRLGHVRRMGEEKPVVVVGRRSDACYAADGVNPLVLDVDDDAGLAALVIALWSKDNNANKGGVDVAIFNAYGSTSPVATSCVYLGQAGGRDRPAHGHAHRRFRS